MPLLIILSHKKPITETELKETLAVEPNMALSIAPAWVLKTSESPRQIEKKLSKAYPEGLFTVFIASSQDWATGTDSDEMKKWINDELDNSSAARWAN